MSYLKRRVQKIEDKLNIGKGKAKAFRIVILPPDGEILPEPVEEWVTYKEALAKQQPQPILFIADPAKELEARKRLQKETEGNKKVRNERANSQTN